LQAWSRLTIVVYTYVRTPYEEELLYPSHGRTATHDPRVQTAPDTAATGNGMDLNGPAKRYELIKMLFKLPILTGPS